MIRAGDSSCAHKDFVLINSTHEEKSFPKTLPGPVRTHLINLCNSFYLSCSGGKSKASAVTFHLSWFWQSREISPLQLWYRCGWFLLCRIDSTQKLRVELYPVACTNLHSSSLQRKSHSSFIQTIAGVVLSYPNLTVIFPGASPGPEFRMRPWGLALSLLPLWAGFGLVTNGHNCGTCLVFSIQSWFVNGVFC